MSETISPNATLAHYPIISKIHGGARHQVYRARDERLNRQVPRIRITRWRAEPTSSQYVVCKNYKSHDH